MKRHKFLTMVFAAFAFAACSSDDVADLSNGQPGWNADGTGYINVTIGLPTRAGSAVRAANDSFDDGDPNEYKVNDVALILFKGSEPNTATFAAAYDMDMTGNNVGDNNDQVTTELTKVQKINSITTSDGEKIYALAVVNRNSVFTVGDDHSLMISGSAFSGSFADFTAKTVLSEGDFTFQGFYMTNAVLVDNPGSSSGMAGANTTILVDVSDNIHPTAQEAEKDPAAEIYVERGVAKVQLTQNMLSTEFNVNYDGGEAELGYTISGWALANKNTSSYLVRNWNQSVSGIDVSGDAWYELSSGGDNVNPSPSELSSNPYRFAGIIPVDAGATDKLYRTYWGIDPNYNSDGSFSAISDNDINDDEIKYCLENTFDVGRQTVKNATCVIVKAKLTLPKGWGSDNFYTVNDNRNVIYKKDDAAKAAAAAALANYEVEAKAALEDKASEASQTGTITITAEATLAKTAGADTKQVKITSVTFTGTIGSSWSSTYTLTGESLADLNKAFVITEYTDAYAYYTVLIKHFGDELTPWSRDNKTDASYPNDQNQADKNWLGRYGVLRNNWYEIEVTGITGIGSATIPHVDTDVTPADEVSNYISCKINVLSWAKRKQSVTLQ